MSAKLDWAEPLIKAQQAMKAAQEHLSSGRHVEARKELWIARRALNEVENASLDISPAPV